MVLDTTETRLNRAENDIETLRTTQTNILNHLDSYSKTVNETRDIAAENRERLGSIEDRLKRMEERQQEMDGRLKRMEERQNLSEEMLLELIGFARENRVILLTIAEHVGLTIENPGDGD